MTVLAVLALGLAALPAAAALPSTPDQNTWVTNNKVWAIDVAPDGTTYIGGTFTYVGPNTGGWAELTADGGQLAGPALCVTGDVKAIAPDGAGGYYIGGSFTYVGTSPRANLAHILADGSLDAEWNPGANGIVQALVVSDTTVYVGGRFTTVAGETRNHLAALTAQGALTPWNPDTTGWVFALALSADGATVYAGGDISTVGGAAHGYIAAIDATSGLVPDSWTAQADDVVYTLTVSGATVYAGGMFKNIGGAARMYIAALDGVTGAANATWNPGAGGAVYALAPTSDGETLYVGGDFNSIGGEVRTAVAALDTSADATGTASSWNPNPNGGVRSLALSDDTTVYVGGRFTTIGGEDRNRVAAVDSDALATDWDPNATGFPPTGAYCVNALAVSDDSVCAGGDFHTIAGVARKYIAALDTNGVPTDWNPEADSNVRCLAMSASGDTVYAGGDFASIGGESRKYIAELDAQGAATGWKPEANFTVYALAVSGQTVYAGGAFSAIGANSPQPARWGIAALDATSGEALPWNPAPEYERMGFPATPEIYALTTSGTTVYAGGAFTKIGGQDRAYLAALDATGAATDWNPGADNFVLTLATSGTTVYAGGQFTKMADQTRNYIAALDASVDSTGTATAWDPNASWAVRALALSPDATTLYTGGEFTTLGGTVMRNRLAAVSTTTGATTDWHPDDGGAVHAIVITDDGSALYTGGEFKTIGGLSRPGFAAFRQQTTPVVAPAPATAQYSDCLSLEATVTPPGAAGVLSFLVNGSAKGLLGSASYDATSGAGSQGYKVPLPAGDYPITASFSPEDTDTVYSGEATLTVTAETMTVTPVCNPTSIAVPWLGGPSGSFLLKATFAQQRDGCYGTISGTQVTCVLTRQTPPGSPLGTSGSYSRTVCLLGHPGPQATPAAFSFTRIPVGAYSVRFFVDNGYYVGGAESTLVITEPPLVWSKWIEPSGSTYRLGSIVKAAFTLKYGVTTDQSTLTVTGPRGVLKIDHQSFTYDSASGEHRYLAAGVYGFATKGWAKGSYVLRVDLPGGAWQSKTIALR
jgi:hypothetical protein